MIDRLIGDSQPGRSAGSGYKDLVCCVATATNESLDLTGQTTEALENLDKSLGQLDSDKTRLISAQVFIANIDDKAIMDSVWNPWIGNDPKHWPQRSCLGVNLGGNWLIEIVVTAARN